MKQEYTRQFVHIGLFICAPVIIIMPGIWQISSLIILLILASVCMLIPAVRKMLYRSHETVLSTGAVSYFLILISIALFFPPHILIASWAVLAFGDGFATLVGSRFPGSRLPWNFQKSTVGFVVFTITATISAGLVLAWYTPLSVAASIRVAVVAACMAAIAESLPWKIDDNIAVTLTAAIAFSLLI